MELGEKQLFYGDYEKWKEKESSGRILILI